MLPLGVALLAGAVAYVAVAAYVWANRRAVGGRPLSVLLLAAGVWTLCYAVELSVTSPADQELWGDLKYIGIVLLPPALWTFALEYTGRRRRMGRLRIGLLMVEPVVVLAALAVPRTHDWVRSVPASAVPGEYTSADTGPIFWVHLVYSYALLMAAIAVLVLGLLRVSRRYALPAWTLIVATLLPFVLNALYNARVPGMDLLDLTPIGFSITGFVLVWGFFRFRLLDLIPVGRRQVVDRIPDAVLVLDARGRVVDANPAAVELIGAPSRRMIGRDVLDLVPPLGVLMGDSGLATHVSGSCALASATGHRDLAVTASPLPDDRYEPTGRLLVLRDVTAQRGVERRLRELVEERTATIDVLQRGLYPARLPQIPEVDVAAVLSPAEADTNIGGDFVDVRASGPGRWTLLVGDVVGKGAGAATLTALARHTTAALTALGLAPSRVLTEVSRAISVEDAATVRDDRDPRFCTLALATIEPVVAGSGLTCGADVVLSLGGHPRPLLLAADGDVREVGVPGTLLGVVDDPDLHDARFRLHPGEALVLFTDGVTEARRGREVFGDDRLVALLSGLTGRSAQDVVDVVVASVRSFGDEADARDDVAVLVARVPAAIPR